MILEHKSTFPKIDFKKHPYRDVFAKVGERLGIEKNNVSVAYRNNSPKIVREVDREIQKINELFSLHRKNAVEAVEIIESLKSREYATA